MAKDPAFLFYHQDFLVGTTFMTLEERGAYITILCYLADKGTISLENILKIIPSPIWDSICVKFKNDNGMFFNERLRFEVEKRKNFAESRRKNLHMDKHMSPHMITHMENENENINEDIVLDLNAEFEKIWNSYPNRQGKKNALRHFLATVKTQQDIDNLLKSLSNYLKCDRVRNGYIQNGSTWFNDWQSWINPSDTMMKGSKNAGTNPSAAVAEPGKYDRFSKNAGSKSVSEQIPVESARLIPREN